MKRAWVRALASAAACALLAGGLWAAEVEVENNGDGNGKAQGQGCRGWRKSAECQAFRKAQQERREAHRQEQQGENQALREESKEKSPQERCAALARHRASQFSENQAFRAEQHQRRLEFLKQELAKNNVPEEKQALILERVNQCFARMQGRCQDRHGECVKMLNELAAKEGLTAEEVKTALSSFHERCQADRKAWREERQAGREAQRQERRQKRHGAEDAAAAE